MDGLVEVQELGGHQAGREGIPRGIRSVLVIGVFIQRPEFVLDVDVLADRLINLDGDIFALLLVVLVAEAFNLGLDPDELNSSLCILEGYNVVVVEEKDLLVLHVALHSLL